ncbi:glycosyltransferase family 39 protein [Phreatobacter aquaticus]|uniref:Glycosyltransferase family 39 protein n=1 Tax=Phreatobacter aquaticus TaxID=2570229 RepID=A0A4D7QKF8_9HYPH|nr:glycosyltransferase family 39 protein [Phreatobacter aquaticus]QCK88180.1 glycosyltransferase family 39 protein [Phreatobacter aquaticus]
MSDGMTGVARARVPERATISVDGVLTFLLLLAMAHLVFVLAIGINQPLLDQHHFRQSQTAISVYWILQGGPWFAYETPVIGHPWAIPFEFPLYQLIVAAVAKLGVPLNAAGRIVSIAFLVATLWPLAILGRDLRLGRTTWLATSILFLCAPVHVYWARTFMIETTALFFSALWLAAIVRLLVRRDLRWFAVALLAGTGACLAKSTTFPAFGFVGAVATAALLGQAWWRGAPLLRLLPFAAMILTATLVPVGIGLWWVAYSDRIKEANLIGRSLTSAALAGWNWGNWQQRTSASLWLTTVRLRVLPDVLGLLVLPGLVVLGACLASWRRLAFAGVAATAFLLPFLLFTNLHIVHNYYQVANAVFLIAALGIAIGVVAEGPTRPLAVVLVAVLATAQLAFFHKAFAPHVTEDFSNNKLLRIAQLARDATKPDEAILVINSDWAGTIPYHAERRALVLPPWTPAPIVARLLSAPQSAFGPAPLAGVVACGEVAAAYGAMREPLQRLIDGLTPLQTFGDCRYLSFSR